MKDSNNDDDDGPRDTLQFGDDDVEEIPRVADPDIIIRQDLMKSYENVIYFNRGLLLKVVQEFEQNPYFRENMRYRFEPPTINRYGRGNTHFRFMDLPTELRREVAKFTMFRRGGLEFFLHKIDDRKTIGHLEDHDRSLSLVSRQVYEETKLIHIECNTIRFAALGGRPDAFYFFIRHAPPAMLKVLKSVELILYVNLLFDSLSHIRLCAGLASKHPNIMFRLLNMYWIIPKTWKGKSDWPKFIAFGIEIQDTIRREFPLAKEEKLCRNWRLFPNVFRNDSKKIQCELHGSDRKLALGWVENGL